MGYFFLDHPVPIGRSRSPFKSPVRSRASHKGETYSREFASICGGHLGGDDMLGEFERKSEDLVNLEDLHWVNLGVLEDLRGN